MQNAVEEKEEHASLLLAVKLIMVELGSREVDHESLAAKRAVRRGDSNDAHDQAASRCSASEVRGGSAMNPLRSTVDEQRISRHLREVAGCERCGGRVEEKMDRLLSLLERQGAMLGMVLAKVSSQPDLSEKFPDRGGSGRDGSETFARVDAGRELESCDAPRAPTVVGSQGAGNGWQGDSLRNSCRGRGARVAEEVKVTMWCCRVAGMKGEAAAGKQASSSTPAAVVPTFEQSQVGIFMMMLSL